MRHKKKHWRECDYVNIYDKQMFGEESMEDAIERMGREWNKCRIMVKTIQSGNILESEIYPVWECSSARAAKKKRSREEQKNLNNKNTCKEIVRYINNNFTTDDLFLTLTYEDYYYPAEDRARKDIVNYINKLKKYRKKHGMSPLKYIYFVSYMTPEEAAHTKTVRMHHHVIINKMDRDTAEDKWTRGPRANSKRLKPDNYDFTAVSKYLAGNKGGKRRWAKSQNLKPPVIHKSVSRLTKRKTADLAHRQPEHKEIFESLYKHAYRFLDSEIYYNQLIGGFYISARMRKKMPEEPDRKGGKKCRAL